MPVLAIDGLALSLGGKPIFEDDAVAVHARDRLGIIGANGTGKSTLMRILVGQLTPDSGRITRAKGLRVGYLAQEHGAVPEASLLDSVLAAAPGRGPLEERIRALEGELEGAASPDDQAELATELADAHALLADLEQRFARHLAEHILFGLGFRADELSRPLATFSGGWRMRAALAALLFQQPDVLLLDEPTNHLDMPSVHWLSGYLDAFPQALVLISHDREFLNRHVQRVVSLEVEGLRTYAGNYDEYLKLRAGELELLENRAKKDEQRKKELEAFVERFRAKATKARQAQSRVKMIEKMEERIVEIPRPRRAMSVRFKPCLRSGDVVLEAKGLGFGWGASPLFSGLDLQVRRGDRVAIVGRNGAGKTTLLKLLAAELQGDEGKISLGSQVTPSYFAQHHADVLDGRRTVLEEVWRAAPALSQTEARAICGAFLFSGDDVEKLVGVLSGGERARVALARMLAAPGNLLLLDEPTNHLDTESATKLTESLEGYDGTMLFVSHNLDFARRLSNKVWDVHDGVVETYPGSLGDYLDHLSALEAALDAPAGSAAPAVPRPPEDTGKEAWRKSKEAASQERKRRGGLERRINEAEARIAALEAEQSALEAELADPRTHTDAQRARELAHRYQEVKRTLEEALGQWESLTLELESLAEA